jgi:hypothetical protein
MMKKLATYFGLALAVLVLGGAGLTYAQGGSWAYGGNGLVDRIAERFNLDQNEVNQVVDEFRQERKAEMKNRGAERLNQAVEDGQITQDQKEMIEQKREEHQSEIQDLSPEVRWQEKNEHREEMHDWAEENNIDIPLGNGPMRHGNRANCK